MVLEVVRGFWVWRLAVFGVLGAGIRGCWGPVVRAMFKEVLGKSGMCARGLLGVELLVFEVCLSC